MNIEDFLPKYPNVNKYNSNLLNPYRQSFYDVIYHKKEFYDLKLEKDLGEIPKVPGELYKHQKIIARFLSTHTPYSSLLLFHHMGSGKTCSAFGLTENIRENEYSNIKGVIVLARGKTLLNNLIHELVFTCSKNGKYIPEDYSILTSLEKVQRIKKNIKDYYHFYKFYEFAKKLTDMSDLTIKKEYSNHIVIIDEIHNIRKKENKKEDVKNTYNQIYRFLHLIQESKVLLMSGTPMKDTPEEMAPLMNLILPVDKNFPTGSKFNNEYLDENMVLKPDKIPYMKERLKGKISYLSIVESNVKKIYMGDYQINNISTFTLYIDVMGRNQGDVYMEAYRRDKKPQIKTVNDKEIKYTELYTNSRQCSLCVFNDGTFGSKLYDTYIKDRNQLPLSIQQYLKMNGLSEKMKLDQLKTLSSKYYTIIKNILDNPKKCVFCYSKFVEGGGAILFSFFLKFFGFSKATGGEKTFGKRYAIFTHKTSTPKEISAIINRFNRADNITGDYIRVIIASKIAGEGLSVKHIQSIHVITPHWNYAEVAQAIARGIRSGSHDDLIQAGIVPTVEIFQHVSVTEDKDFVSVDKMAYEIAAKKDISIKSVERVMKESAIDCALLYNANYNSQDMDYSRNCDYNICKYSCDGITNMNIKPQELDYSTYNLYYNNEEIELIIQKIKELFQTQFIYNIIDLQETLNSYNTFEILQALDKIIMKNIPILNRYGLTNYVREYNNYYYLVENIFNDNDYFSSYYTENVLLQKDVSFNSIIEKLQIRYIPKIIDEMIGTQDMEKFKLLIQKLPLQWKEYLLESSVVAEKKGLTKNVEFRNRLLEFYEHVLFTLDNGMLISKLLPNNIRCYRNKKWFTCEESDLETLAQHEEKTKEHFLENPYGYYGILEPIANKFLIRNIQVPLNPQNRKKKYIGQVCTSYDKKDLLQIIDKIKLEYPEQKENRSREELYTQLPDYIKSWLSPEASKEDILRLIHWSKISKTKMCPKLQEWFEKNNLLFIGEKEKK